MTLTELSQLYYLSTEIDADQQRLERLTAQRTREEERLRAMRAAADGVGSLNLDGMPHGSGGAGSRHEANVMRIMEQQERVREKRAAILSLQTIISQRQTLRLMERARLQSYISSIQDSMTRQIFMARFIDGLSWSDVADAVGGYNTADGVKKACYRYIRAHDEQT